ncbi:MAG: PTS sugar transporter subunit IIA [Desulfococcaceae bacterium]
MKLTIDEVAQCLDLPAGTLKRWVRQGRIPIQKNVEGYVFKKSVLEKWAQSHNLMFSDSEKDKVLEPELENLLPVMRRGDIFYDLKGHNTETVLKSAVSMMDHLTEAERDELYRHLLERERLTSTGIGKGIAIPHPRSPMPEISPIPLIFTCFPDQPVEFSAVDKKTVFILFILLSPSSKCHLHLLSRLAFCVRDDSFVEFLRTKPEAEDIYLRIADAEARLEQKGMF